MHNIAIIKTPIGFINIQTNLNAVCKIRFAYPNDNFMILTPEKYHSFIMRQTIMELLEYFYEKRKKFNVRLNISSPPFYKKVLSKLMEIPFGKTVSYKDIAIKLNNKNATRAVGTANKLNPIPIIIPCHRVISSNGNLGGYNAGFKKKIYLLKHEGVYFDY